MSTPHEVNFNIKEHNNEDYNIIEFEPDDDDTKRYVKELQFYLFGGNGNTSRAGMGVSREKTKEYENDLKRRWDRMKHEIETDPNEVTNKTKDALSLMDYFLKEIGKRPITDQFTSTLYGEGRAFNIRHLIELGIDTMAFIRKLHYEGKPKKVWCCSQLSPYIPYAGMLFLKDLKKQEKTRELLQEAYEKLIDEYDEIGFKRIEPCKPQELKNPYCCSHPQEAWREIHKSIYAEIKELVEPHYIGSNSWFDENVYNFGLLLHFPEKCIYSGSSMYGWLIPVGEAGLKVEDVVDFYMVTGREFWEDGTVKFMLFE